MVKSSEKNDAILEKTTRWSRIYDDSIETNRTVIIDMLPAAFNSEITSSFLTGVIFTILGKTEKDKDKSKIIENIIKLESEILLNTENSNIDLHKSVEKYSRFRVTFTSTISTLICLKLNGISIGSLSNKIVCKRPEEYISPPEGDPLEKFILPNIIQPLHLKINEGEKCILKDLPTDISEEKIRKQLETIGKLKSLNIVCDPITGIPKGTGSFEYEESSLCHKAINLFHGRPIESTKNGIWNIQLGRGIVAKSNANNINHVSIIGDSNSKIIHDNNEYIHVSNLPNSMSYKLFNNPILCLVMKYSKVIGETPSQIIQLLNIFLPEELVDDTEFNSIVDSVKSEAETYGTILEVFCPRPKNIEDYHNCCGAGKIFIYFSDITSARRAQYQFNGRIFDNIKTISATFYPLEKYLRREYNLISYLTKH